MHSQKPKRSWRPTAQREGGGVRRWSQWWRRVKERVCAVLCAVVYGTPQQGNTSLQSQRGQITCRNPPLFSIKLPQPCNGISFHSYAFCAPTFPKHLHLHTQKLKITKFIEVGPYSIRHTLMHAKHLQLCTLSPFQGVGRPINTTLQGLRDWA